MECVAYMRVSTEKQAEEGYGLDSQKRDILSYAGKNEYVIKEWYVDDGYTGANTNRPALQRLINDCYAKKIKTIIAFKLDRLSRSMVDGIYLIEKIFIPNKVEFKCVHDSVGYDSPMEQAYTQMMAVFTQLDKNTMLLRMRGGMLERVKAGYWMGGGNLPYCYTYDREIGILKPIPERAEQANKALDLFIDGMPDKKIGELLGFKTDKVVRSVLTSLVNIGMIPYKGNVYQGLHEPIFEKEKYETAMRLRESRRVHRMCDRNVHLLSGLCFCGDCGCSMRYQKWGDYDTIYCYSRNRDKSYIPNWNPNCRNSVSRAEDIEKAVEEQILQISLNLKFDDLSNPVEKIDIISDEIETTKNKLKRLYSIYADGNDTVVEMITELEDKVKSLKQQISQEQNTEENQTKKMQKYESIKKVADVWEHIDNKNKNKILKSIIDKITIVNDEITITLR